MMSKENHQLVEVLSASRYILKLDNLYNKGDLYIYSQKVPNYLIPVAMHLFMIGFLICELWFCYDEDFVLHTVSPALALSFASVQIVAMNSTLLWKRDLMMFTIDDLQNTVTRSN